MQKRIGGATIEVVKGDITKENVDAIVNAANSTLLGGGGVDGAIHRAAGPALKEACEKLGGCPTGDAKITGGGRLPARHVIHAVGPRYRGGQEDEASLLANCYRRSLILAKENGLKSIAFPAISCGIYGYPIPEAARIAMATVADFLKDNDALELVRFVMFSDETLRPFEGALEDVSKEAG